MEKVKRLFKFVHEHGRRFLTLLYIPIYMTCFTLLERYYTPTYHIINSPWDDKIPFIEIFIIPYILWFFYMGYGIVYTIFKDKSRYYYHMATALFIGMTLFIITSYYYPNKLEIRPDTFVRDNIFTHMVARLYKIDTPTNVLPSIHVFNSVVIHFGLCRAPFYNRKKYMKVLSLIFITTIILSTLFLKQHSIVDASQGLVLALLVYPFVYGRFNGWCKRLWTWYDRKYY